MGGSFPQGHALVIGVGTYAHIKGADAPHTVLDAAEVTRVLIDSQLCGYDEKNIIFLKEEKATRDNILASLALLSGKLDDKDTLLVFYAGHGMYDRDGGYTLTTHDTQLTKVNGKKRVVPGSAVSEDELKDYLRAMPVKRMLLVFNACHSGEISPGQLGGEQAQPAFESLSVPRESAEKILSSGEGRIIITASRPQQKSLYPPDKTTLTYFGQALVDGLSGRGSIPSNGGYISAYALYEYVYSTVSTTVQKLWGKAGWVQEPELTVIKGVGLFPVSLHQGTAPGVLGEFDASEPLPATAREVNITIESQVNIASVAGPLHTGSGNIGLTGEDLKTFLSFMEKLLAASQGPPAQPPAQPQGGSITFGSGATVGGDVFTGPKTVYNTGGTPTGAAAAGEPPRLPSGAPFNWDSEAKWALVDLLLECDTIQNDNDRNTLINNLPRQVRGGTKRAPNQRLDTFNLVTACLRFKGGLQAMIDELGNFEQGTDSYVAVQAYLAGKL